MTLQEKPGPVMREKCTDRDEYPAVHTWNYVTVEGYCMLNVTYSMCSSRYNYELKPGGSFVRRKNDQYDPAQKPDPFPENCKRSVLPSCIGCRHFGWCEPNHSGRKSRSARPRTIR
ncbi:MAG TPA: hypothetical protein PKM50_03620 [Methanoregula sp.]|nr:hypothetical protein [Methanoregula sp.]